jgi:hypothetical protein
MRMRMPVSGVTGGKLALAALAVVVVTPAAHALAPLYDPVVLNIGVNCQWQQSCERRQRHAMDGARKFIAKSRPPLWRIQLCNKNARRGPARIDWVGFNACIRNPSLAPLPRRRR